MSLKLKLPLARFSIVNRLPAVQPDARTPDTTAPEADVPEALGASAAEWKELCLKCEQLRQENEHLSAQLAAAARFEALSGALEWTPTQKPEAWVIRALEGTVSALGGLQASLYRPDPAQNKLRLMGGFALTEDVPATISFGDGLMGQLALSGRRHPAPKQYKVAVEVPGGALGLTARAMALLPLLHNNQVEGILEVLCLETLSAADLRLLELAGKCLGANLYAMRSQAQIRTLLEESVERNNTLLQQEEELRNTIETLQAMQDEMRATQTELAELNNQLELHVQDRTAELKAAVNELQNTQDQLVLSEKMAALGQLVAGVAHEINSPIGAIKASAGIMAEIMPQTLDDLPLLLAELHTEDLSDLFRRLIGEALAAKSHALLPKEERQLRRRLAGELEPLGLEDVDGLATYLVGAGFSGDINPYLPLLRPGLAERVAQTVFRLRQLRLNLENINLAVDKTKKVVFALKSYAHSSDGHQLSEVDLRENIETVLIIYHNQLKYGIELSAELEELPAQLAYGDELSQVWTNLIQNAIQAMKGQGKIHISLKREADGSILAAIQDSGPGIPPEIQARIFEPFFTTKKRGEGTGLGLDIVQRIVQRHGGTLTFESEPGRTRFLVRLPWNPAEENRGAESQETHPAFLSSNFSN